VSGVDVAAFLSDAWFDRARSLTDDLPEQPGVDCRLQFDAVDDDGGHQRWHQVIVDGRIEAWQPGDLADADVELRWPLDVARRLYAADLDGTAAMDALTVAYAAGGSIVTGRPSPLDIGDTAEIDALPAIPDATLVTQFRLFSGPFGPVRFWWTFVDGLSTDMAFGDHPEPDVIVRIRFQRMVAVRCGHISVLEALEDGGQILEGGVGPLMLLAGLQESPELLAAGRACGPSGPALAALGRVTDRPEHRTAIAALAAATA
jgi:hypothetical protein